MLIRNQMLDLNYLLAAIGISLLVPSILVFFLYRKTSRLQQFITEKITQYPIEIQTLLFSAQQANLEKFSQGQLATQQIISETIQRYMMDIRDQMNQSFKQHSEALTSHLNTLTQEIRNQLALLTQQVNNRLSEGFEKTSGTFIDIVKRLTIIDEAQKKITELSSHVVSLQDVLIDKRARGAFGEVQLAHLISNMIPTAHYKLQYTLSNQKRADCILFLPQPTGNIIIDAKFPLETYQKLANCLASSFEYKSHQQQFRSDLQKHIKDISEKYIISNETCDGAMMFIPAEGIFAEIHANYPEIVALSQKSKVWMVSPSTLMAVLTTAKAVLKDDATRKQVHIIQKHLQSLAEDFHRFEKRMDKLTKHIDLAHQDANEVNTSAKKITQRFQKIEAVEVGLEEVQLLEEAVEE
jgi:DNA recombination protein RmuC